MTRHTQAMVLRQSVVSSMGKVLFWKKRGVRGRIIKNEKPQSDIRLGRLRSH